MGTSSGFKHCFGPITEGNEREPHHGWSVSTRPGENVTQVLHIPQTNGGQLDDSSSDVSRP